MRSLILVACLSAASLAVSRTNDVLREAIDAVHAFIATVIFAMVAAAAFVVRPFVDGFSLLGVLAGTAITPAIAGYSGPADGVLRHERFGRLRSAARNI